MAVIVDNLLPQDQFDQLCAAVLGYNFPWYWADQINNYDDSSDASGIPSDASLTWQFQHLVHDGSQVTSTLWPLVEPILSRIQPKSIVRIKFNLNTCWPTDGFYGYHKDMASNVYQSAIYYLTDSDAGTMFNDGSVVEDKANRLLLFDSDIPHTGKPPTTTIRRVVMSVIYVPYTY